MANDTQTYTLEGKTYTVPAGTSMDELDSFVKQQDASSAPKPQPANAALKAHPTSLEYKNISQRESPAKLIERQKNAIGLANGLGYTAQAASLVGGAGELLDAGLPVAKVATTMGKGLVGSILGGYGAKKAAQYVGAPEWAQDAVGLAGGIAGGLYGGRIKAPDTVKLPLGFEIPTRNPPTLGSPENPGWYSKLPDTMPKAIDPVAEAVRRGDAVRLPTRMPDPDEPYVPPRLDKVPLEQSPIGPETNPPGLTNKIPLKMPRGRNSGIVSNLGSGEPIGAEAGLPDNLVLTPEQARAQEQMQRVALNLAKQRGAQYAGGLRPAGPNANPNVWGPKQ